jgi:hypothetical protein
MPRTVQLPDGRTLVIPDDATPEQLAALKTKLAAQYGMGQQSTEAQQAAALAPSTLAQSRATLRRPIDQPDFTERLQRAGNPGSFEGKPENIGQYVPETVGRAASGVADVSRGNVARGAREMLSGGTNALLPMAPFVVAGAPLAAAVGTGTGLAGSYTAQKVAETAGATPDQAGLVGDIGGLVAGGAGAKYGAPAVSRGVSAVQDTVGDAFFTPNTNRFDAKRPVELAARTLLNRPETSADQALQNSVDLAVRRAALLRDAKTQAGFLPPMGSAAREAGFTPPTVLVPDRPVPSSPLTPESLPGPSTSGKQNLLTPIAKRSDPRAAQELLRRGRNVLYVPDDIGSMSAKDFAKLLAGLLGDKQ